MASAGNITSSPKGYPLEIFNEISVKYLCSQCKFALRNPVQSYCGHRFCKECLEHRIKASPGEEIVCNQCKDEDSVNEFSILNLEQAFPDNAIKREMSNFAVKCCHPGCSWSGQFKNFELHYDACDWFPLKCGVCGKEFVRGEADCHMCDPQQGGELCPIGCGQKVESGLEEHLRNRLMEHFTLLGSRIDVIEKVTGLKRGPESEQQNLQDRLQKLESNVAQSKNQTKQMAGQGPTRDAQPVVAVGASDLVTPMLGITEKMNIYEGVITVLNREVERLSLRVDTSETQRRQDREMLVALEHKVKTLERTVVTKDATIAELDLRIGFLEQTSYDGTLIWKITDFQRRRQEAISGRATSIYSPAFYTSRNGYKMCARIYLNGDGMGKGTHVSLFFVVMRGQFDALLKWPFRQKVTLMFLDQNNREHVVDAFRPDPTSSSFKRPTTEMNIASGCPLLMTLTQLDNPMHGYSKDNVAFVKIIVSTEEL